MLVCESLESDSQNQVADSTVCVCVCVHLQGVRMRVYLHTLKFLWDRAKQWTHRKRSPPHTQEVHANTHRSLYIGVSGEVIGP